LRKLESRYLSILYVDNIALATPSYLITNVLNVFNSFHYRLQFTIKLGGEALDFLDVTIKIINNSIEFDWFYKPIFSGRYLNFLSLHPVSQKRGIVIGMIMRFYFRIPNHLKNLELVINILLNNDYFLGFIFEILHLRLKFLIQRHNYIFSNNKKIEQRSKFISDTEYLHHAYVSILNNL